MVQCFGQDWFKCQVVGFRQAANRGRNERALVMQKQQTWHFLAIFAKTPSRSEGMPYWDAKDYLIVVEGKRTVA
jgi:hypothetical protein